MIYRREKSISMMFAEKIPFTSVFPSIWLPNSLRTTSHTSCNTRWKLAANKAAFSATRWTSRYSTRGAIASVVGKLSGDQAKWNIAFFRGGLIYKSDAKLIIFRLINII